MDRGTWQAAVLGDAKSQTWLSNFHILFSIVAVPVYIPASCVGGSLLSTPSPASIVCVDFLMVVILAGER